MHTLTPQWLWLVWSYSENNQHWSFPKWICRYYGLKIAAIQLHWKVYEANNLPKKTKLAYRFAGAKTHQRTLLLKVILWVHFKNQPSISLNRLYFLSVWALRAIHMDASLACAEQRELPRFIKGIWSLMPSPLINLNSTSDRLSGAHRDTQYVHSHTNERWMRDLKQQSTEGRHKPRANEGKRKKLVLRAKNWLRNKDERRRKMDRIIVAN